MREVLERVFGSLSPELSPYYGECAGEVLRTQRFDVEGCPPYYFTFEMDEEGVLVDIWYKPYGASDLWGLDLRSYDVVDLLRDEADVSLLREDVEKKVLPVLQADEVRRRGL